MNNQSVWQWMGLLVPIVGLAGAVSGSHAQAAPAAPAVQELKFGEIFKLPVGPKGFELSARALSLDGKPVRVTGYMVSRETTVPGQLILSPLPVSIGDEDESFSDDLPASAVFVHLSPALARETVPNLRGLMQLSGTLHLGHFDEPDGRVANAWIDLDDDQSRALPKASPMAASH